MSISSQFILFLQDYKDKHKLVCRYKTNNHPLLLIAPAKEEEIYLDPYLVVYHNVISDQEVAVIKSIATPKVRLSTIMVLGEFSISIAFIFVVNNYCSYVNNILSFT